MARASVSNDRLLADILGTKAELRATSLTEFVTKSLPDIKLIFEPTSDGAAKKMRLDGEKEVAAVYEAVADYAPFAAELSAFAGDYASDELGVSFWLGVVENKLQLIAILDPEGFKRSGGIPLNELHPVVSIPRQSRGL
jgi:hypothetical protein